MVIQLDGRPLLFGPLAGPKEHRRHAGVGDATFGGSATPAGTRARPHATTKVIVVGIELKTEIG
jgi:hypothetical protein